MTLPELAIKRPVTTLMVLVSIVVLGIVALNRLPLAFMPDITEPELFINLPYDNASPEQVERMIVRPVEDAVGSVRGLQSMWSRCGSDGGRIRLEFGWDADMHLAGGARPPEERRPCPHCGATISKHATRCAWCGTFLAPSE